VNRIVAGVFGGDAPARCSAARRSLEAEGAHELVSPPLACAWTGSALPSGPRAVVLAGRVRNLPALAKELGTAREEEAEHVLALAFDRWGEQMLGRLRGGFALVAWDPDTSRGLLAVDQLGAASLFLHEASGQLTFATEMRNLVRLLPGHPAPDPASVAQWIVDGYLERGCTLLQGIRRLEGGHFLRLGDGGWRTVRYWAPGYVPPERSAEATLAAELHSQLGRAVRERMAAGGSTGVLLSGGLDSSTVAAVASRVDRAPGAVRAYSLVFPDHPEADESALIEHATSALGIPSVQTPVRAGGALSAALEFQRAWELPALSPTLVFNVPLLRRAADEGVKVVLDGEGGDELFGCSPYLVADRLRRGDVRGALALVRRLPGVGLAPSHRLLWSLARKYGLRGAAPYALHRAVRRVRRAGRYAPGWLTPDSARLYLDARDNWAWKLRSGPRWWAFLSDLLTSGRERMGAHDFLRRRAQLAGLETRHPLLDDLDLIEFVLCLPPDLAFDPELNRPFVRAALAPLLPDAIRLRGAKSDFSPLFVDALSGADRALTDDLLASANAEIWSYARRDRVRALVETPPDRRTVTWAWQVWRLATTECWLRSQSDARFAERMLELAERGDASGVLVSDGVPSA
jgi:asparagine synthase (glutamine-hydrolysing)